MPAAPLDVRDQMGRRKPGLLGWEQIESQRKHVAGLRLAFDAAVSRDIRTTEGRAYVVKQALELLRFVGLVQHRGGARGQVGAVGEVSRVDDVLGRVGVDRSEEHTSEL